MTLLLTPTRERVVVPPDFREWPPTSSSKVEWRCEMTMNTSEGHLLMFTTTPGGVGTEHLEG